MTSAVSVARGYTAVGRARPRPPHAGLASFLAPAPERVEDFVSVRRPAGYSTWLSVRSTALALEYLRELGVVPAAAVVVVGDPSREYWLTVASSQAPPTRPIQAGAGTALACRSFADRARPLV